MMSFDDFSFTKAAIFIVLETDGRTDGRADGRTGGRADGWTDERTDGWTPPLFKNMTTVNNFFTTQHNA